MGEERIPPPTQEEGEEAEARAGTSGKNPLPLSFYAGMEDCRMGGAGWRNFVLTPLGGWRLQRMGSAVSCWWIVRPDRYGVRYGMVRYGMIRCGTVTVRQRYGNVMVRYGNHTVRLRYG